jgi:hypothetical protein
MAIDERTRHEMYSGLEQKLGVAVADALVAHLPPVGWADVATRQDVERLETRIGDIHRLMLWLFTTQLAVVGVMIAIAKVT